MNSNIKQRGFSIIEVVLVLAIAGLIFLMVFIALPALQRSQRDSARQQEVGTVVAAIGTYSSSNNGKLPTSAGQITSIIEGNTSGALKSERKVTVHTSTTAGATITGSSDIDAAITATLLPYDNIAIYNGMKCGEGDAGKTTTLSKGTTRQAAVLAYLEGNVIYCRQY